MGNQGSEVGQESLVHGPSQERTGSWKLVFGTEEPKEAALQISGDTKTPFLPHTDATLQGFRAMLSQENPEKEGFVLCLIAAYPIIRVRDKGVS